MSNSVNCNPARHTVPGPALAGLFFLILFCFANLCQGQDSIPSSVALKKLSLEELMNINVTAVSKRSEKISEVASAIQVITQEDIRRSGATNLPEALRLAANLQVAQVRSNAWIISARGFNAAFSNKLLVMIDRRTVYSPLFAGVFWDAQSVLLEDVERIEVISGPGGTLWGANAVNGIINIITKNAKNSKGLYASAAAGNLLRNFGAVRYGGSNKSGKLSYRVFAQRSEYNDLHLPNGDSNNDKWDLTHGGFRADWSLSDIRTLMLQGNIYAGKQQTSPDHSPMNGQNFMARYIRRKSPTSGLIIQAYFDRTWRKDIPGSISDQLNTYDFDIQHQFPISKNHLFMWGAGYRFMHDEVTNHSQLAGLLPPTRNLHLMSGFVQHETFTTNNKFRFTIGTKLQHYTYSDFSLQPSARISFIPNSHNTIWAAASRAVRAPSRIDKDYFIPTYPVNPGDLNVNGGPDFIPEKAYAYEIGYRVKPAEKLFFSLAAFYNKYNDLYSVEALPGTQTYQTMNGVEGFSNGLELSATCQVVQGWHLKGGYTYFFKKLENKPGRVYDHSSLGYDPKNQVLLHSMADLPGNFQFNVFGRFVSSRPAPLAGEYITVNANVAWMYKQFVVSIVGQNLTEAGHPELTTTLIPRNIYAKITCRF